MPRSQESDSDLDPLEWGIIDGSPPRHGDEGHLEMGRRMRYPDEGIQSNLKPSSVVRMSCDGLTRVGLLDAQHWKVNVRVNSIGSLSS